MGNTNKEQTTAPVTLYKILTQIPNEDSATIDTVHEMIIYGHEAFGMYLEEVAATRKNYNDFCVEIFDALVPPGTQVMSRSRHNRLRYDSQINWELVDRTESDITYITGSVCYSEVTYSELRTFEEFCKACMPYRHSYKFADLQWLVCAKIHWIEQIHGVCEWYDGGVFQPVITVEELIDLKRIMADEATKLLQKYDNSFEWMARDRDDLEAIVHEYGEEKNEEKTD